MMFKVLIQLYLCKYKEEVSIVITLPFTEQFLTFANYFQEVRITKKESIRDGTY